MNKSTEKHIYFIRHGQSRSNATRIIEGPESPLTEEGIEQATRVAERFRTIPIDVLYSSTYTRALGTAEKLSEMLGISVEILSELHERKFPSALIGKPWADEEGAHLREEQMQSWITGENVTDGESFEQLVERARFVKKTLEEKEANNIAVVGHGFFGKILTFYLLLGDELTPQLFVHKLLPRTQGANTGVTHFTFTETDGWILRVWNDHAHLG